MPKTNGTNGPEVLSLIQQASMRRWGEGAERGPYLHGREALPAASRNQGRSLLKTLVFTAALEDGFLIFLPAEPESERRSARKAPRP